MLYLLAFRAVSKSSYRIKKYILFHSVLPAQKPTIAAKQDHVFLTFLLVALASGYEEGGCSEEESTDCDDYEE